MRPPSFPRTSSRRTVDEHPLGWLAVAAVLILLVSVLVGCNPGQDVVCTPTEAKRFDPKPACNFKTVGDQCSMEHRRDVAANTGQPVVCTRAPQAPRGEPLRWHVDNRPSRKK